MLVEKVRDLGLDRPGEQGTGPVAQDFGELIVEDSWLNQLDDVILGHGISLLRWRSGGVKYPHDMPPSRFPTSPTLGDSSSSEDRNIRWALMSAKEVRMAIEAQPKHEPVAQG
jgi:hypothetical protein